MYQGYSLALEKLEQATMGKTQNAIPLHQWRFLKIREVIQSDLRHLTKHLVIGKRQFFKTFYLAPLESWAWLLFLLSPLLLFTAFWLYAHWETPIHISQPDVTGSQLFWYTVATFFALLPISAKVREWFKTIPWLRKLKQNPASDTGSKVIGLGVMMLAVLAWLVTFIHLRIFNNIFLKNGQLK